MSARASEGRTSAPGAYPNRRRLRYDRRVWVKRLVSPFVLASFFATPGCDADDGPDFGDVVLLVTGSATMEPGDMSIEDRLSLLMYSTRVIDEPSLTSEDVEAQDVGFVYVSASVGSSATLESLEDTRKAVIVAQAFLADDFGLVQSDAAVREVNMATAGPEDPLAQWTIEDREHPALGMESAGAFEPWTEDGGNVVPMVRPPESGTVLVSYPGGYATVMAYDRGKSLADGETKSPSRRVLFVYEPRAPTIFTADTWRLFEAVVTWAFPL